MTGMSEKAMSQLREIVKLAQAGLNQTEIGGKVHLSQGAVSQYVNHARQLGMLPPSGSRHPAGKTVLRLEGHAKRWRGRFTAEELAAIETVTSALDRIRGDDGW